MNTALYDSIGKRYRNYRMPHTRIGALLSREIGDARTVVNLGAGLGSYEPRNRAVVAVEPSRVMIDQRGRSRTAVVHACAETLPFRQDTFDCALAVLTIHHWSDIERGLREALRVARRTVVLPMTAKNRDLWRRRVNERGKMTHDDDRHQRQPEEDVEHGDPAGESARRRRIARCRERIGHPYCLFSLFFSISAESSSASR